jgi:hypothetical protein
MGSEFLKYLASILNHFLAPISLIYFSTNFGSILIIFNPLFRWLYLCQFLPTYTLPTSRGSKIDKIRQNWTPQNRFLLYSSVYIFRSERSALRPPKKWHFWPPHWSKSTADLWGMGFPIGPLMGVDFGGPKVESFCKKCGIFKKFIKRGSPGPGIKIDRFLTFWPPRRFVIFWWFLGRFLTSIFNPKFE